MSEIYLTAHSRVGMLRFRFEHDSIPTVTLMTHLERLHFLRVTGGPANAPIAVSGIRRDDPLLCVMERTIPNPAAQKSDRFLDRRRETIVPTSNQIEISVDTTGSEILVGWFEEP
jgi:hypothetical protein